MGDVYDLVNTAKTKFSASRVVLSGVLRREDVSWRRSGAVNDRLEWIANTPGVYSDSKESLLLLNTAKTKFSASRVVLSGVAEGRLVMAVHWSS